MAHAKNVALMVIVTVAKCAPMEDAPAQMGMNAMGSAAATMSTAMRANATATTTATATGRARIFPPMIIIVAVAT